MPALISAGVSAVGAVASAVGSFSKPDPKFEMGAKSGFEAEGERNAEQGLAGYRSAMSNEFAAGSNAQNDLAGMLAEYAKTGAIPNAQDIQRSQSFARSQFDPQRVAQQQAFQQQLTGANRQAAMSGRGINDPILRAKLAQEQTRQGAMLEAQQGAFATQFAQQQPFQRLGFMSDRANTLVSRGQNALNANFNMANQGLNAQQQGYGQRYDMAATMYNQQANTRSEGEKIGSLLGGIGSAGTAFSGVLNEQMGKMASMMGGMPGGMSGMPGGMSGMGAGAGNSLGSMFGSGFGQMGSTGGSTGTASGASPFAQQQVRSQNLVLDSGWRPWSPTPKF